MFPTERTTDLSFRLDLSALSLADLHARSGITPQEMRSIFENPKSRYLFTEKAFFVIGYSLQKRIIQIAFTISQLLEFDLLILQTELPDEEEIERFYCKSC